MPFRPRKLLGSHFEITDIIVENFSNALNGYDNNYVRVYGHLHTVILSWAGDDGNNKDNK